MRRLLNLTVEQNAEMQYFVRNISDILNDTKFLLSQPRDCGLWATTVNALKEVAEPMEDLLYYYEKIHEAALDLQTKLQGQYVSIEGMRAAFIPQRFFSITPDGDIVEVDDDTAQALGILTSDNERNVPVKARLGKLQVDAETEAKMWADNLSSKRMHEAESYIREVDTWKPKEQL